MIEKLRTQFDDSGELTVTYQQSQYDLYMTAHREFQEIAESKDLKHHTLEIHRACGETQAKYRKEGLLMDLYPLPKGIQNTGGNFAAMAVKHFLEQRGFRVLVSESDYYMFRERGHHYTNRGFNLICDFFGSEKVGALLASSTNRGGDPDIFAYLERDPLQAWFFEAKQPTDKLNRNQKEHFPIIREHLCPVIIANTQVSPSGS